MTANIANTMISNILNATLPTATGGKPTAFTNMATTSAMTLKLTSTQSTASASGTEITGTGYTTNGATLGVSTPSSGGSAVTLPASQIQWTNGSGSAWNIDSGEVLDSSQTRGWFGRFTGAGSLSVANTNIFQVAANAISISIVNS